MLKSKLSLSSIYSILCKKGIVLKNLFNSIKFSLLFTAQYNKLQMYNLYT